MRKFHLLTVLSMFSLPVMATDFFADHVWPKVGELTCLNCHQPGGEADLDDSRFVIEDILAFSGQERSKALERNRKAFAKMNRMQIKGKSRLLSKAFGDVKHGGNSAVKKSSPGYAILDQYSRSLKPGYTPTEADKMAAVRYSEEDFFTGLSHLADQQLLRRLSLSLSGRLPTDEEFKLVKRDGQKGIEQIMNRLMKEEAFYDRLAEGFNDIFLTIGYNVIPERVLGYRNFGETRHWTQKVDFSHLPEKEQKPAEYKLNREYREAILREPMELIRYIVRNERPFTELVTADYIMVSPYTSKGYGIFDEIKERFKDPENHLEFIPVKLKALKTRDGKPDQITPTDMFPHAGMLTTFHYLKRYPTTETNRNRLRARMYFEHFLGIDIMALAPRVTDAAETDSKYKVPTMEAPDCVVCHTHIDPIAGLFQDYYNLNLDFGPYGPRKEGWYKDIFDPGFNGEKIPKEEMWRSLQWLGERTAKDPRFAEAMAKHVYYILTGRKVMQSPKNLDDPSFLARRRAYIMQKDALASVAKSLKQDGFNLKTAFKEWVKSEFYRVNGLSAASEDENRLAELDDIGVVRLLSPEQLERKIIAVFGKSWGKLKDQTAILYGGIDSKTVTERISSPSGAMGAIQRIMANEIACSTVPVEFTTPKNERRFFKLVEKDVYPGSHADAEQRIRQTIAHLHERILGQINTSQDPEINRTYELFSSIVEQAKQLKSFEKREIYSCRGSDDNRVDDPHYVLRAWRAVVTYLLRRQEFLYE